MKSPRRLMTLLLSLSALFLMSNSCDDPPPTGENTFSCYIDGRLFVPKPIGELMFPPPIPLRAGIYDNELFIAVTDFKDNRGRLTIRLNPFEGEGDYVLKDGVSEQDLNEPKYSYMSYRIKGNDFFSRETLGNIVRITSYDPKSEVVKGVFHVILESKDNKTRVDITSGRFDFNLKTLNVINP